MKLKLTQTEMAEELINVFANKQMAILDGYKKKVKTQTFGQTVAEYEEIIEGKKPKEIKKKKRSYKEAEAWETQDNL